MNSSFWPFLWFGLPGRRLTKILLSFKFSSGFSPRFRLFSIFLASPPAERPRNPFRDIFRTSDRKAQMTPVKGQRYRNPKCLLESAVCLIAQLSPRATFCEVTSKARLNETNGRNRSAGRGLFRKGVVRVSPSKPGEPRKTRDEKLKAIPFYTINSSISRNHENHGNQENHEKKYNLNNPSSKQTPFGAPNKNCEITNCQRFETLQQTDRNHNQLANFIAAFTLQTLSFFLSSARRVSRPERCSKTARSLSVRSLCVADSAEVQHNIVSALNLKTI